MEYEVKTVAGLETCYVSLPLPLIQNLESTRRDGQFLQQALALELRSSATNELWHVAWSGSASSSPHTVEVSQEFAKCINLLDCTTVLVRALPNVPNASVVSIEPDTEDDWEVMELNAEAAEAAILQQVRVVHETMKFPLWLHGRTVVTFLVVSVDPKNAVVQLVTGTEVVVTPKRRRKTDDYASDPLEKVLLRVQDAKDTLYERSVLGDVKIRVELTSAVLIHPQTAADHSFDLLQAVVIQPRLPSKKKLEKYGSDESGEKVSSLPRVVDDKSSTYQEGRPYAVARILFSDSAAKGHMVLSRSLRRFLGANFHSWVFVHKCVSSPEGAISKFSVAPCKFLMRRLLSDDSEVLNDQPKQATKLHYGISESNVDFPGPSAHDELLSALSSESHPEINGNAIFDDPSKGINTFLQAWFTAQDHGISSIAGKKASSLVLGPRTMICFEMMVDHDGPHEKLERSAKGCLDSNSWTSEIVNSISFVLCVSGDSLHGEKYKGYEIVFEGGSKISNTSKLFENVALDKSLSLNALEERCFGHSFRSSLSALSWMSEAASSVTNRLKLLLSPSSVMWFSTRHLPFPGHALIYGPPGSGKTLLASAVAKVLEEDDGLFVHIVFISCSALASEKFTTIRRVLGDHISEALNHAPSLVILDDFDSIVSSNADSEGAQEYTSVTALGEFITRIIDDYTEKQRATCGTGPIAFLTCARNVDSIPHSLRASGRFDFHVQLPAPGASERIGLLKHEIERRSLLCSDDILLEVAAKCEGYDAYDLEILVDRSIHSATGRFLWFHATPERRGMPSLILDDFLQALNGFLPVSMRDITKSSTEGGRHGWEDIGGLIDVRNAIKEMLELPSKFPSIFAKCPLRLRSNVLLYGPPGCGKTHIVGAAAAASSLRFISVKGPELLNKYIGASEQAVRDIFLKAAAAAPCLLFFDEFDSIAPKRGHDNTGVTDRVVNQFLTELDGVEVLSGVFVFAATSRPDLLDAALLRPGRLDRLLFCDFPSLDDRLHILGVLSRKLQLADDIDLLSVAHMTDGFSGADLQALLSDAQLAAVQDLLDSSDSGTLQKMPVINNDLLKSIASQARPSVSESEKRRLYGIYNQFLGSKRSIAAQTRDLKGKKATLA